MIPLKTNISQQYVPIKLFLLNAIALSIFSVATLNNRFVFNKFDRQSSILNDDHSTVVVLNIITVSAAVFSSSSERTYIVSN